MEKKFETIGETFRENEAMATYKTKTLTVAVFDQNVEHTIWCVRRMNMNSSFDKERLDGAIPWNGQPLERGDRLVLHDFHETTCFELH